MRLLHMGNILYKVQKLQIAKEHFRKTDTFYINQFTLLGKSYVWFVIDQKLVDNGTFLDK